MRIIFEEHQYEVAKVQKVLEGITTLQDVEQKISVSYVGYYYNPCIGDCVFILPKVLLTDKNKQEVLANVKSKETGGDIMPEDIITQEGQEKHLPKDYRKFLYEFAVWIYRSLSVYRKLNKERKAIYYRQLPQEGKGRRREINTYLDIVLSLVRFNQENQNFFLFTIKNLHSGLNKINWAKTISHSQPLIQHDNVLYLNPVNKKRQVNYEEELFVIFFSILNYLNSTYGFRTPINCNYELIKGHRFENYLKGRGKIHLRQIKYKYFADKTLQLWDLCFAFFETSHRIAVNADQKEYMLAKNFNIVFEAMIDELIGEKNPPRGLKEQTDGKRVDHMYTYYGLTHSNEQQDEIYYIGDSKYYKARHPLGRESVYKQYTYARNVIQWNIDLFMKGQHDGWTDEEKNAYLKDKEKYGKIRLRDDEQDPLTEGYNVIPNFFISAYVDEKRTYVANKNIEVHQGQNTYTSFQFEDRLFDRDTLILSHYDVNFLYVLYLYARNKQNEKRAWRTEVHEIFRNEIRRVLQDKYDFFALKSRGNALAGEQFIKEHFKELQGKLYRPYGDKNLYSLAIEKKKGERAEDSEAYHLLEELFEVTKVDLGYNPQNELDQKVAAYRAQQIGIEESKDWLPKYHLERYPTAKVLIGAYHGDDQLKWILKNHLYNIRLDKDRDGAQKETELKNIDAKFLILYEAENEFNNKYTIYKINGTGGRKKEKTMKEDLKYYRAKGDYYCYELDDEVNIGQFNLFTIISRARIDRKISKDGELLIMSCEELLKYKL